MKNHRYTVWSHAKVKENPEDTYHPISSHTTRTAAMKVADKRYADGYPFYLKDNRTGIVLAQGLPALGWYKVH